MIYMSNKTGKIWELAVVYVGIDHAKSFVRLRTNQGKYNVTSRSFITREKHPLKFLDEHFTFIGWVSQ